MNTDRVNKWLTLAANFGVLIGLFLLVAELRQNTRISELNFYMERRAMANRLTEVKLDEGTSGIIVKSILQPDELTHGEIEVLGSYLGLRLNTWRITYIQEELGFREPGSADNYLELTIDYAFGNPAALTWWRINREGFPLELKESFDAALVNVDPDFGYRRLTAIQEDLRSLGTGDVSP